MINIILTLDYEIFGNGEGDVNRHIIKPTDQIIRVCDRNEIPLVVMFETLEYMKFEEFDEKLKKTLGYSPAHLIRNQITEIGKAGHDVQLHLHHQWEDARFDDGKWIIKNPKISILQLSAEKIDKFIKMGKSVLEKILRPDRPDYSCIALRLTNLPWIEAPKLVHQPMINNGIKVHSLSVSSNKKNNEKGYWALDNTEKIFEFPIHSCFVPFYRVITTKRILNELHRRKFRRKESASPKKDTELLKGKRNSIMGLMTSRYDLKWDFCKQSAVEMLKFLKIGIERYNYKDKEVPLVMIGHTKDIFRAEEIDKFLKLTKEKYVSKGIVRFSTLRDFVDRNLT